MSKKNAELENLPSTAAKAQKQKSKTEEFDFETTIDALLALASKRERQAKRYANSNELSSLNYGENVDATSQLTHELSDGKKTFISSDRDCAVGVASTVNTTEGQTATATTANKLRTIYDLKWNKKIDDLKEFKKRHGHVDVPRIYRPNQGLAYWVCNQRYSFRYKLLSQERIDSLNEMGFDWNTTKSSAPVATGSINPNAMSPQIKTKPAPVPFGTQSSNASASVESCSGTTESQMMVKSLKMKGKENGGMTPGPVSAANKKNRAARCHMTAKRQKFFEHRWTVGITALKDFQQRHGHINVPQTYKPNQFLANWVRTQRQAFRNKTLSQERIESLTQLGFFGSDLKKSNRELLTPTSSSAPVVPIGTYYEKEDFSLTCNDPDTTPSSGILVHANNACASANPSHDSVSSLVVATTPNRSEPPLSNPLTSFVLTNPESGTTIDGTKLEYNLSNNSPNKLVVASIVWSELPKKEVHPRHDPKEAEDEDDDAADDDDDVV